MCNKTFCKILRPLFFGSLYLFFSTSLQAKEISLKHNDLTLNAELELAEGKELKDGLILITHGSLAHRDMQTLQYLRSVLHEYEYSTLSVNLSLGINNRHGMYDCKTPHHHLYEDALDEIDAWVNWLKEQGAQKITLLGHSKGGAQTALYAAQRDCELIKSIILIAPSIKTKEDSKELQSQIQEAKILMASGKSEQELFEVPIMHCKNSQATVKSFLSYNDFSPRQDTPTLLSKIKKPSLILIGGKDTVVVGLEKRVAPLADGKNIHMKIIETADHFFDGLNMDEAVGEMDEFLQGYLR